MGWNSWNWVGARVDCDVEPYRCLDEQLMYEMTDALINSGMQDAGYSIINLSEGWPYTSRDANGALLPDPKRFPSGLKNLSDYIHSKGLQFGIYLDCGTQTCAGYPGSQGHEQQDVATIVGWGADYVWMDGCNFPVAQMKDKYTEWSVLFNSSGRNIIWEASWPAYDPSADIEYVASIAHEWRYYRDIRPEWSVVMDIVDFTVENNFSQYARPGQWNLPDMLEVGNPPLTVAESRSHFSLWAMLASPLHAGNDLRNMTQDIIDILTNREVIAVDQDPLGKQGTRVARFNSSSGVHASGNNCTSWNETQNGYFETCAGADGNLYCFSSMKLADAENWCCSNPFCAGFSYGPDGSGCFKRDMDCNFVPDPGFVGLAKPNFVPPPLGEVYARELSDASRAVLLLNRGDAPMEICADWTSIGLNPFAAASVRDLWQHADLGRATGSYCALVESHDVAMYRIQQ